MKFVTALLLLVTVASLDAAGPAPRNAPLAATGTSSAHKTPPGKILFVGTVGSKSHKNFYYGLIEAMAAEGHQVTLLTPYPPSRKIPNVREIVMENNNLAPNMLNLFKEGKIAHLFNILNVGPEMCFKALQLKAFQDVLQEEFDLAFVSVFFNECFLPSIHAKKIPFVFVHPAEIHGLFNGLRMGNPIFSSFDDNPLLNFQNPKSFLQRLISVVADCGLMGFHYYVTSSLNRRGLELGLYPPNTPSIAGISADASLMIANSFRLAEHPRPYMPNILLAGGIHCQPPKPLPQDLKDWVVSSGDAGFIFFSLGSAVRASDMPEETVRIMVSVFGSLSQKVLWKYDLSEVAGGLPNNVRLTKWAPQQDLLGDPRIRLFITHGGLFSTQEATYHGVPVLGLPVFGNMNKAELQGWGKKLSWDELTEDKLRTTILSLIDDKVARAKVQQLGQLMKDRPTSPAADVAWWTGYLIRTRGAKHLRSGAADLAWYQLYNTDVWLVLVLTHLLLLWLLWAAVRRIARRCCGSASKKTAKKQKRH